mgnify:CR=1 FL=1
MMIRTILAIFVVLIVISSFTPVLASADNDTFYTTVEGKLFLSGAEPFVNLFLKVNQKTIYSLSGEDISELKNLSGATIRITGLVKDPRVPRSSGDLEVIKYFVIKPKDNLNSDWAIGRVFSSDSGYILIGQNQVIYKLNNFQDLDLEKYVQAKMLLFGDIEYFNQFYAEVDIEGYNVISKPK